MLHNTGMTPLKKAMARFSLLCICRLRVNALEMSFTCPLMRVLSVIKVFLKFAVYKQYETIDYNYSFQRIFKHET